MHLRFFFAKRRSEEGASYGAQGKANRTACKEKQRKLIKEAYKRQKEILTLFNRLEKEHKVKHDQLPFAFPPAFACAKAMHLRMRSEASFGAKLPSERSFLRSEASFGAKLPSERSFLRSEASFGAKLPSSRSFLRSEASFGAKKESQIF